MMMKGTTRVVKNGAKVLAVGLVLVLLFALVACGSSNAGRGMETDNPSEVVAEVFTRYTNGDDYKVLFASDLSESKIDGALEAWAADGGVYIIVTPGDVMYKGINGKDVSLKSGETICGVKGGVYAGDLAVFKGQGYAIVAEGSTSGSYYIVDFAYKSDETGL
jgi:hypothetical protein